MFNGKDTRFSFCHSLVSESLRMCGRHNGRLTLNFGCICKVDVHVADNPGFPLHSLSHIELIDRTVRNDSISH